MVTPVLRESLRFAYLLPVQPDASPLPLEKTSVTAQVLGPLATVTVTQHFSNPLTEPVELEYLMPLPHTAAIIAFELQTGGRTIRGDLKETEQARQTFEKARQEGQRAGLLESRRPNLFAVQLTHVQPGEPILAVLQYQERLTYDDGAYQFVFPMGLTPKYHSPGHPEESRGVDAPVSLGWEPIGLVDISVEIDAAGAAAGSPTSPTHPLVVTCQDDRRTSVQLAAPTLPNKDFVLRYPAAQAEVSLAAWCTPAAAGGENKLAQQYTFLATLVPPALEVDETSAAPREFIFVLDRSGSMSGEPISQARNALRACLRTLAPMDQFRILLFDDRLEWYRTSATPVTQAEIDAADRFLATCEGRGGTEIVAALEAALSLPMESSRSRTVVFLTDGAVSGEERAIERLRSLAGSARIFTFGIGPSVNRALLQRMAQAGRGTAEFLQLDEDIESAIIRFQDRVAFPLVTDLALTLEKGQAWDIYPALLPDLYLGQTLEIVGQFKPQGSGQPRLIAQGQRGGRAVTMQVTLQPSEAPLPAVVRAWARARLDDLLQQEELQGAQAQRLRSEIISLALEYGLVPRYTSFVAVDTETTGKKRTPRLIQVSQPLPAGLQPAGFFGPPMAQAAFAPMPPSPMRMAPSSAGSGKLSIGDAVESTMEALPSFFKRAKDIRTAKVDAAPPPGLSQPHIAETRPEKDESEDRANPLNWLARIQQLDGSWRGEVELTSAALLAFLRSGHTTRSGSYRQQVRRATQWLSAQSASGFAAFARAAALSELAALTGAPAQQAADNALASLPAAATSLENAARVLLNRGGPVPAGPDSIRNLDDLRLAALLKVVLPVPAELLGSELGRAWAATLR
jgi:Ca-activated chloride channel homolog